MKKTFFSRLVLLLLLCVVHFSTAPVWAAKPALLFILDGQSNAAPHGNGDALANSWKQEVADTLINPQKVRNTNENNGVANPFLQSWIAANPYEMRALDFGIQDSGFGPELTFIKTLKPHFPNHILAVAQRSLGGTSIVAWDKNHSNAAWNQAMNQAHGPNQLPKPPQYPQLMELKQQAVTTLNQLGGVSSVTVAGLLWVQNEQDVGNTYGAQHYEENLRKLVRNVRADWAVPQMPFMFVNAHTHDGSVNAQRVDDAVEAVKNSEPKTAVINTKDLGTHEGTHYNTSGTVELGIRFANAFMNIYDPDASTPPQPSPRPSPRVSPSPSPSLHPSPSPTPTPTPPEDWDLNDDTVINSYDFVMFVEGLGSSYQLNFARLLIADILSITD